MELVAKANIEGLIWIVIGIFWIGAQLFGASAKKKREEQQRRLDAGESDTEDAPHPQPGAHESFAELIRRLSGESEPVFQPPQWTEEEPVDEAPGEPAPATAAWSRSAVDQLPDVRPSRRIPPPAPRLPPKTPPPEEALRHLRPKLSDFRMSTPTVRLPSMILRMTSSAAVHPQKRGSGPPPDLMNRQTLRRAMLGHVILGKPKALDPSFHDQRGV